MIRYYGAYNCRPKGDSPDIYGWNHPMRSLSYNWFAPEGCFLDSDLTLHSKRGSYAPSLLIIAHVSEKLIIFLAHFRDRNDEKDESQIAWYNRHKDIFIWTSSTFDTISVIVDPLILYSPVKRLMGLVSIAILNRLLLICPFAASICIFTTFLYSRNIRLSIF